MQPSFRVLVVISLGLLGLLLAERFAHFVDSTQYGAWERLPPPPSPIVELILPGGFPLYVKTSTGATYVYDHRGWVAEDPVHTIPNPVQVQDPCDLSAPEFSQMQRLFPQVNDCLQIDVAYPDGFMHYAYVLDAHGYLWESAATHNSYDYLSSTMCFAALGAFFGLSVGVAVTRKSKKPT